MNNILEVKGISKSFGSIKAVDNLSFNVKEGELFAFLGANGAGKSTTINIICGQIELDSGEIRIDGRFIKKQPLEIKNSLGVVFQGSHLDGALTVYDNLQSRAALYGIFGEVFKERLKKLSGLLEFENLLKRTVSKLSGGQRRRIDIARALIHNPKILILDEPTTGLDPQTRRLLWNVIATLRKENNMTVFLTTHYMEEAADADYIIILEGGKIAAKGSPLELKNTYTGDFITLYNVSLKQVEELEMPYEKIGGFYRITVESTAAATKLIQEHPHIFSDYEITKGKMDDVFLAVTGRVITEGEEK